MSKVKQKVIEAIDELSEVEYSFKELKELLQDSEFKDLLSTELQDVFQECFQDFEEELSRKIVHLEAVVNRYLD